MWDIKMNLKYVGYENEHKNEFKVSELLTLKLIEDKTYIYVKKKRFSQCIRLMLTINQKNGDLQEEIKSIDEAGEKLGIDNETEDEIKIDPKTEFWGHCSNLQVWIEHNYNTELLHRNLAFPLLKKLTRLGDPYATRVFKSEIAKRLCSKTECVIEYLLEENYIKDFLSFEELDALIENDEFLKDYIFNGLKEGISHFSKSQIKKLLNKYKSEVTSLNLRYYQMNLKKLGDFPNLNLLKIYGNGIVEFPEVLYNLRKLEFLEIGNTEIPRFPLKIREMKKLKTLSLNYNGFRSIPAGIKDLINLENLALSSNELTRIPIWIYKLNKLSFLDLGQNFIDKIPQTIKRLKNLHELSLDNNNIKSLTFSLEDFPNLQILDLRSNRIQTIDPSFFKPSQLKVLNLSQNFINEIPKEIGKLKSLERLDIYRNNITELPIEIGQLSNLKCLELEDNPMDDIPKIIFSLPKLIQLRVDTNIYRKHRVKLRQLENEKKVGIIINGRNNF